MSDDNDALKPAQDEEETRLDDESVAGVVGGIEQPLVGDGPDVQIF